MSYLCKIFQNGCFLSNYFIIKHLYNLRNTHYFKNKLLLISEINASVQ